MNHIHLKFQVLIFLLCLSFSMLAQSFKISGKVTDEKNEALTGVNIKVKEAGVVAVTDFNGNYSITIPDMNSVLVFSYIGYQTRTIAVKGNKILNVNLQEDSKQMDEVVVIGYGSMKKSDITGSVSSVKMAGVEEKSYSNMQQILSGRLAGVTVNEVSGQPGSALNIEIRGAGSISLSTQPLYVIDGVPFDVPSVSGGNTYVNGVSISPIANINPNDIASIEVLKDASATAIYGSRASNGVVLITTKSGSLGKPKYSINYTHTFSNKLNEFKVLNSTDYATFENEITTNKGYTVVPFTNDELLNLPYYNHQNEIFRIAETKDLSLTLSGGTADSKYYLSGQYFDQEGVVLNSNFRRLNLKFNYDTNLSKKLKLTTSLNLMNSFSNGTNVSTWGGSFLTSAVGWAPTSPYKNPDGSYNIIPNYMHGDQSMDDPVWGTLYYKDRFKSSVIPSLSTLGYTYQNPLAYTMDYVNENTNLIFNGISELSYEINKQLLVKGKVAATTTNSLVENYRPTYIPVESSWRGMAYIGNTWAYKMLYETTLNYKNDISQHHILGVVGATSEQYVTKSSSSSSKGFTQDITGVNLIDAGTILQAPSSFYSAYQLVSFLTRVNYNYDYKYYVTLSARYDGSSKFADDKQFGFFPSGAVSWRVSKESFMKNLTFISDLKLRASSGLTGNQAVSPYSSLSILGSGDTDATNKYNTTFGGVVNSGYAPKGVPNKNLTWEQTAQSNIGLDLSLFKNRINLTAELYYKYTSNLLYNVELPWSTGFKTMMTNIGEISNKGLEITLSTTNIKGKGFEWRTDFNISWNKNRVEKLTGVGGYSVPIAAYNTISPYYSLLTAGKELGDILGYETLPVWDPTTLATKPTTFQPGVTEGTRRYKDQNGDGILNDQDRVFLGSSLPQFTGGFNNSFSYKGFELGILFGFSYGNKMLNIFNMPYTNMSSPLNILQKNFDNRYIIPTADMGQQTKDRISANNAVTHYQVSGGMADYREICDLMVEDASFIRCKEISIAYNLPTKIVSSIRCSSIRFFGNIQNPFIITNYSGANPEASSSGLARGIDYGSYPLNQSIKFGLNVNF